MIPGARVAALMLLAAAPRLVRAQAAFYRSDSVLTLTLRTDLHALYGDRDTANAPWRQGSLTVTGGERDVTVPVRVRTRGVYRLKNCDVPPIRLRFDQGDVRGTVFEDLRRPKLSTYCRPRSEYEQYVLLEYAIYRVYRLLTPRSLSVRLLRITYEDSSGAARPVTRYGFVIEDQEKLAQRLGDTLSPATGVRFSALDPDEVALLGVFEYFIANTDWSLPGRHNIALFGGPTGLHPLPYDFDWAGSVDAVYARPDPSLPIHSVRERIYRGLCQSQERLEPVLARFEALKDSIAAIYRSVPGLDPRTVERTLRYYDDFYHLVQDRRRFVAQIQPDCRR